MAHDSNHGHSKENKTIISFKSSFWLIIIIVGLFVAALNFIKAESGGEGEEGQGKKEGVEKVEGEAAKTEKGTEQKHAEPAHEKAETADTAHKSTHE